MSEILSAKIMGLWRQRHLDHGLAISTYTRVIDSHEALRERVEKLERVAFLARAFHGEGFDADAVYTAFRAGLERGREGGSRMTEKKDLSDYTITHVQAMFDDGTTQTWELAEPFAGDAVPDITRGNGVISFGDAKHSFIQLRVEKLDGLVWMTSPPNDD